MAVWQKVLGHLATKPEGRSPLGGGWLRVLPFALGMPGLIALWAALVRLTELPAFILPGPDRVWSTFLTIAVDGTLISHSLTTLGEVLSGLLLGLAVAFPLGYLLSRSRAVEQIVAPYIVASQSIPTVAIAPLLVIWFGPGVSSKIIVSALIVFFPILVSTTAGLRSAEPELRDLMRSYEANRWQTFALLELPAALGMVLSGVKVGATLSVIGAVVGEFVGADRGLGFLIKQGQGLYDTSLIFVATSTLIVIALTLYGLTSLLERVLLRWQE